MLGHTSAHSEGGREGSCAQVFEVVSFVSSKSGLGCVHVCGHYPLLIALAARGKRLASNQWDQCSVHHVDTHTLLGVCCAYMNFECGNTARIDLVQGKDH
jgi:hypothetical protein